MNSKHITAMHHLSPVKIRQQAPKSEGCLICGQELVYAQSPNPETCQVCGRQFNTAVRCQAGHYICDECHAGDILKKVEYLLDYTQETDPVSLAQKVFELPGLNMHGPEYHSIVPAVIVTAYQNQQGKRQIDDIQESLDRGRAVKGGSCGLHGNCGAGVGAGIAVSIIEKATPMTGQARSQANRATAQALLAISEHIGPRCCKRDAITAISSFVENTSYFPKEQKRPYICSQFQGNKSCIQESCPYYLLRKDHQND